MGVNPLVSAHNFSLEGDKYLGQPYSEIDCQKLVEKMLNDSGIKIDLAGSNAWYRKILKEGWIGTPEECKKKFGSIPNGAFLFILEHNGKEPEKYKSDGLGNASHIGAKTGRKAEQMLSVVIEQQSTNNDKKALRQKASHGDGAIHASSTRQCVATSTFADRTISGGWNRVGLWSQLDYGPKINSLLSGNGDQEEPIEVVIPLQKATVKTDSGTGVNLRSRKSTASGTYMSKIPEGTVLDIYDNDGTWASTEYDGKNGYVMCQFLQFEDGASGDISLCLPKSAAEALYTALGNALSGGVG